MSCQAVLCSGDDDKCFDDIDSEQFFDALQWKSKVWKGSRWSGSNTLKFGTYEKWIDKTQDENWGWKIFHWNCLFIVYSL